ncbi:MAG: hypothetical protein ACYCSO_07560 [Cuniculiplasma sp.]
MDENGFGQRLLRNLDGLNWKLIISIEPETEVSIASIRYGLNSEIGLYLDRNPAEINLYFKNDPNNMDRNLSLFISRSRGKLEGDVWRIQRKVSKATPFIEKLKELLGITSCVLTSTWLKNGKYYSEFIFNYSEMEKVSDIILDFNEESLMFSVEFMGPSDGYEKILRKINERNPLSVIQMVLKNVKERENESSLKSMGDHWIRVLKKPIETGNLDAVYFLDGTPAHDKNVKEIKKNRIYYARAHTNYILAVNREIHKRRLVTLGRIQVFDNKYLRPYLIVPEIFVQSITELLLEVAAQFTDWSSTFERIQTLEEWLERS